MPIFAIVWEADCIRDLNDARAFVLLKLQFNIRYSAFDHYRVFRKLAILWSHLVRKMAREVINEKKYFTKHVNIEEGYACCRYFIVLWFLKAHFFH